MKRNGGCLDDDPCILCELFSGCLEYMRHTFVSIEFHRASCQSPGLISVTGRPPNLISAREGRLLAMRVRSYSRLPHLAGISNSRTREKQVQHDVLVFKDITLSKKGVVIFLYSPQRIAIEAASGISSPGTGNFFPALPRIH